MNQFAFFSGRSPFANLTKGAKPARDPRAKRLPGLAGRALSERFEVESLESRQLLTADLVGTVAGAVGTFAQGATINASFGRINFGTTAVTNFSTRFVLSVDNVFGNGDDIFLSDVVNTTPLNPNAPQVSSVQLVVPSNAAPNQNYYVLGKIDINNDVAETNETNNEFGTDSALITVTAAPQVSIAATTAVTGEGSGTAGLFTLTRTGNLSSALTVNLSIAGTATNGTDYTTIATTVTFLANSSTATITVSPIDDNLAEQTETTIITIASGTGYVAAAGNNAATVSILDNEPQVGVAATTANTSEVNGSQAGRFTFTRTGSTASSMTINFLVSGTATNGTDYTQIPTSVTFAAGSSTATIDVAAINDGVFEVSETAIITLQSNVAYSLDLANSAATVTIADSSPIVSVAATTNTTNESNGSTPGRFTFSRTGSTAADLTFTYTITGTAVNGTDYNTLSGTVTILAGSATATVDVVALVDSTPEVTETVILTINSNASYGIGTAAATVSITDNAPVVSIAATDAFASEYTGDTGRFTFTRTGPTSAPLTVSYILSGTAVNGNDYASLSGTITFLAGSATAVLTVTPNADAVREPTRTVIATIAAGSSYVADGAANSGTISLADNDVGTGSLAELTTSFTLGASTVRPGQSISGNLTLRNAGTASADNFTTQVVISTNNIFGDADDIVINTLRTAGNALARGTSRSSAFSFTVPAGLNPGAYYVIARADVGGEVSQTNRVSHTSPVGAVGNFTVAQPPVISIAATRNLATEVNAGSSASNGRFTFTRTGPLGFALTVNYTLAGTATAGTDYQNLSGTITFLAGAATATLDVVVTADNTAESLESVIVSIGRGSGYNASLTAQSATVRITDSSPVVTLRATTPSATEGAAAGRFRVTRVGSTTAPLVVNYTVSGTATSGSDFTALSGTVTIPAGQLGADILLSALQDNTAENTESVILTLAASSNYAAAAGFSSATMAVVDSTPLVTVTAAGPAYEGGQRTSRFTFTRTGPTTQPLTVSYDIAGNAVADTDYTALSGSITIPAGAASATATVTPIDNTTGDPVRIVTVSVAPDVGYRAAPGSASIAIVDDEPLVGIAATDPSAVQGVANDVIRYTITRAGPTTSPLMVSYSIGGTAVSGTDFSALPGTLTIPAGAASATITITPANSGQIQDDKTIVITLTGNSGYNLGPTPSAVGVISTNGPLVTVTSAGPAFEGGQRTSRFTFTRTGSLTAPMTVNYNVAGNAVADTDYTALAGSVIIPAGAASATVTVTPINNSTGDGPRAVIVNVASGSGYRAGPAPATIAINDDEPVVSIVAARNTATEGRAIESLRYTVARLGGSITQPLTVSYSVSGTATSGSDYNALSGTVTIPAGRLSADIVIPALADLIVEGDETVILTLTGNTGYRVGTNSAATGTIRNAGTPDLAFSSITASAQNISLTTPGQTTAVTLNYQNLGAATSAIFRIEVRLSANNIYGDADDIVLGFVDVPALAALSSGSTVFTINWDAVRSPALGNYNIVARINNTPQPGSSALSGSTGTQVITVVP